MIPARSVPPALTAASCCPVVGAAPASPTKREGAADDSGAESEHGASAQELRAVDLTVHELVDEVVLDRSGVVAPVLLERLCGSLGPSLSSYSLLPASAAISTGGASTPSREARGAPSSVLLVESSSALMGWLSHVRALLVKECSAYGSRFPKVVRCGRGDVAGARHEALGAGPLAALVLVAPSVTTGAETA